MENKLVEAEAELKEIFQNTNSWLQFAEAKNAALIAFNTAILSAILDTLDMDILRAITALFLITSTFCCLISFKPRKHVTKCLGNKTDTDNILFYQDIAKYMEREYLKKFHEDYYEGIPLQCMQNSKRIKYYIQEITCNSKITVMKYKCFNMGLKIDFLSVIFLGLLIVIA